MSIDVVVTNYHTPTDLQEFLDSLTRFPPTAPISLTVIEVEVAPYRHHFTWGQGHSGLVIGVQGNCGYGRACNLGASQGDHDVIALFNADVLLTEGAVQDCHDALLAQSQWGALGPRQTDDRGHITHAGIFGTLASPVHRGWWSHDHGQYSDVCEAVTVSGAAYFVKRTAWDALAACPRYRRVAPEAEGAFLPTPHYYEETWCLPEDTQVWTPQGPVAIQDMRAGMEVWGYHEDSGEIRRASVSWAGTTGIKPVLEIVCRGRNVRVTDDHVLLVAEGVQVNGKGGWLVWKKAGDLSVGDCLVAATTLPVKPSIEWDVSPPMMQFLGQYVGNGTHDERSITIALPPESRVRSEYEDLAVMCFTKLTSWTRRGRSTVGRSETDVVVQNRPRSFRFSTAEGVRRLIEMGFDGTAKTKRVPPWVFEMPEEHRLAFLAGIVDSDGHVNAQGEMVLGFSNRRLIEDVRMLLVSCGLPVSAVSVKPAGRVLMPSGQRSDAAEAYRISCSDPGRIPFFDSKYRERVRVRPQRGGRRLAQRLGLDADFWAVRRITDVRGLGDEVVYDLTVPDLGSFVAEGVVVHNCSYHLQAHGYRVGYYGPVGIIHKWHRASEPGGWADQQMMRSRQLFRSACDAHGIEHD